MSLLSPVEAGTYVPSLMTEVVQGLLQGFLVNSIEDNIEFINSPPGAVELTHLLYQAYNGEDSFLIHNLLDFLTNCIASLVENNVNLQDNQNFCQKDGSLDAKQLYS
ncbi:6287_t:CDS:2 [Diversispora eburnea]|uniref:6287_t:CDS:1 n=1 Tax=Diversispora eburnea TaxID=1213867 RepID=A0A9N8UWI1_9GLOM|nr:6287_t:CDS:2 [Diversispora eburnea]